jgi:hypothetical protein
MYYFLGRRVDEFLAELVVAEVCVQHLEALLRLNFTDAFRLHLECVDSLVNLIGVHDLNDERLLV